jgi:hypothetical protein
VADKAFCHNRTVRTPIVFSDAAQPKAFLWRRNPGQGRLFEHAPQHVWQKRFYDFNIWSERKRIEKLRYMHRNPVKRGLVESPELWRWSSFRACSLGETGPVAVNAWQVLKMKIRPPAA